MFPCLAGDWAEFQNPPRQVAVEGQAWWGRQESSARVWDQHLSTPHHFDCYHPSVPQLNQSPLPSAVKPCAAKRDSAGSRNPKKCLCRSLLTNGEILSQVSRAKLTEIPLRPSFPQSPLLVASAAPPFPQIPPSPSL